MTAPHSSPNPRSRVESAGLRFADAPRIPPPELPKPLAQRGAQVVDMMRRIRGEMDGQSLSLEELERHGARIVHWAEHVRWFAGGKLESQVYDLKLSLLRTASAEAGQGAMELCAQAFYGLPEGTQLALRRYGQGDDSDALLVRNLLLSTRLTAGFQAILNHLEPSVGHLEQGAIRTALSSNLPLLMLGVIGELTGTADHESLELAGSPIQVSPAQVQELVPSTIDRNPLVRSAAYRSIAYALRCSPDLRANPEIIAALKLPIANEESLRVRGRIIEAIGALADQQRGELVLSLLSVPGPELQAVTLRFAEGCHHDGLKTALVKRFQKVLQAELPPSLSATHIALARAVRGALPSPLEASLRAAVLTPHPSTSHRALALYALAGLRDDQFEGTCAGLLRTAPDDLLNTPAAEALAFGCGEQAQDLIAQLALDKRSGAYTRITALSALPVVTGVHAQRSLCTILRDEDDESVLTEVVQAFGRFKQNFVRASLREAIGKSMLRGDGRASAIDILHRPMDSAETTVFQRELREGTDECRMAAASALLRGGLNCVDGERTFGLICEAAEEACESGLSGRPSALGAALNRFMRVNGLA